MQLVDLGEVVRPKRHKLNIGVAPFGALQSVRDLMPGDLWDALREAVRNHAYGVCEVCGCIGSKMFTNCLWQYQDGVQTLVDMEWVCEPCFLVRRLDVAESLSVTAEVLQHWGRVSGLSTQEIGDRLDGFMSQQSQWQGVGWKLDLSWLVSTFPGLCTEEMVDGWVQEWSNRRSRSRD